jgi:hypothetical protein
MKKFFTFFMATAILFSSYAATPIAASFASLPPVEVPALNANNIMLPVGKTGKTISLMNLANISVKDFQTLTGKKMKIWDKAGFKIAQKQLRNKLEADGTVKQDVARKLAKGMADGTSGFHLGGFALGFLVGLIGVLIAYLLDDDKKSNRVKWAWIGLAAAIVFYLLLIVAIL